MKKLIVFLALLGAISISFAQNTRFELNNGAGGKIVLKTDICVKNGVKFDRLFSAYSYSRLGVTISGCWALIDDKIMIQWDGGERSVFEPTIFTFIN